MSNHLKTRYSAYILSYYGDRRSVKAWAKWRSGENHRNTQLAIVRRLKQRLNGEDFTDEEVIFGKRFDKNYIGNDELSRFLDEDPTLIEMVDQAVKAVIPALIKDLGERVLRHQKYFLAEEIKKLRIPNDSMYPFVSLGSQDNQPLSESFSDAVGLWLERRGIENEVFEGISLAQRAFDFWEGEDLRDDSIAYACKKAMELVEMYKEVDADLANKSIT